MIINSGENGYEEINEDSVYNIGIRLRRDWLDWCCGAHFAHYALLVARVVFLLQGLRAIQPLVCRYKAVQEPLRGVSLQSLHDTQDQGSTSNSGLLCDASIGLLCQDHLFPRIHRALHVLPVLLLCLQD